MAMSVATLFLALVCVAASRINERPIIGIMTEPGLFPASSILVASYVKFVESAGARAVPIFWDAPREEIRTVVQSVNGVLWPGGGVTLRNGTAYEDVSRFVWELGLEMNDKGIHFPMWGTCLGFELIGILAAKNDSILCRGCFDSESLSLPLQFTNASETSTLFRSLPEDLLHAAATENITTNEHQSGIKPEDFASNIHIRNFFNILSTNVDRDGKGFISTMEGINYPVYAVQWHPEKAVFEWTTTAGISHHPAAVQLAQALGNVFVNEARKNNNTFKSMDAEEEALIYNYTPIRGLTSYFEQEYIWFCKEVDYQDITDYLESKILKRGIRVAPGSYSIGHLQRGGHCSRQ
ncbi:hypothetical protein AAMO2058_000850100 [Amorphochlora amoebiformis]